MSSLRDNEDGVRDGVQSGVERLGGANRPRIFRSKYVRDGYKSSCAVCVGALGGYPLFISLSWWLTQWLTQDLEKMYIVLRG